jgi:endopolyphosphatase
MHPDPFYLENSFVRRACHQHTNNETQTAPRRSKHRFYPANRPDGESVGPDYVSLLKSRLPQDYGPFDSDFDPNDNRTAGHFGVPDAPCDAPLSLINITFEYLEKVWKDKIDFIVWTGDNVRYFPHLTLGLM